MSFFISPQKLNAATQSDNQFRLEHRSASWYLSPDGGQAYAAASTLGEKVLFFYKYLLSTVPVFRAETYNRTFIFDESPKDTDYKGKALSVAWIMADAIAVSQLTYAVWPDILDEQKNPLLRWLKQEERKLDELTAEALIAAMRQGGAEPFRLRSISDYQKLTPYSTEAEDAYLVERELLLSFRGLFSAGGSTANAEDEDDEEALLRKLNDLMRQDDLSLSVAEKALADELEAVKRATDQADDVLGDGPADTVVKLRQTDRQYKFKSRMEAGNDALRDACSDYAIAAERSAEDLTEKLEKNETKALLRQSLPRLLPIQRENLTLAKPARSKVLVYLEAYALPFAIVLGALILLLSIIGKPSAFLSFLTLLQIPAVVFLIMGRVGKTVKEDIAVLEQDADWLQRVNAIDYRSNRQRFLRECRTLDRYCEERIGAIHTEKESIMAKNESHLEQVIHTCAVALAYSDQKLERLTNTLKEQSLLHEDYWFLAGDVARILDAGRADSFKEALNLAIEEDRREREEEARAEEVRRRQEALEDQLRQEREAQARMERIAREQAEEERRWHAAQQEAAEKAQKAAEDAARQQRWAAEAAAKRAANHSMNAYYEAKKTYDSERRMYASAVKVHGLNSGDAILHKANMDKAMAAMINSGYSG